MENETEKPQAGAETEAKKEDNTISETASIIEKADAVAKRMEQANKKAEDLLIRQEAVAARMMLSGRAEAGQVKKSAEEEVNEKLDADVKAAINRYR